MNYKALKNVARFSDTLLSAELAVRKVIFCLINLVNLIGNSVQKHQNRTPAHQFPSATITFGATRLA